MTVERLDDSIVVPANSSRFFEDRDEARSQPTAEVQLAWSEQDPFLYNELFNDSVIAHDLHYCTSVVDIDQKVQVPTTTYLAHVLKQLRPRPTIVDIGCGQGEFVESATALYDVNAYGFDPVLRDPADNLFARYWDGSVPHVDLFVMRCVLPHIPDPFQFLKGLARAGQRSLVLIEYQRFEWMAAASVWYQISHDHVNLFRLEDFEARFDIVDHGTFSRGEWAWVLVDPGTFRDPAPQTCHLRAEVESLLDARREFLDRAARQDRPLALWGAAGKGIVLAHALHSHGGGDLVAIDADPARTGRFMEVSGTQIFGPRQLDDVLAPESQILVCNPNHLHEIRVEVDGRWDVALPADVLRAPKSGGGAQPA